MVDVTAQPNEIDEVQEVSLSSEYRGANDPVKQTDQVDLLVRTRREIRKRSPRIHHQLKLLPRGLGQIKWCKSPGMKNVQTDLEDM